MAVVVCVDGEEGGGRLDASREERRRTVESPGGGAPGLDSGKVRK